MHPTLSLEETLERCEIKKESEEDKEQVVTN
jgi:hypothetical protein